MSHTHQRTAEDGRQDVSGKVDLLFRLKQNISKNTKWLQTFSDLKDIAVNRVKDDYHKIHHNNTARHKRDIK